MPPRVAEIKGLCGRIRNGRKRQERDGLLTFNQ
jgi:hypothetical protein